MLRNVGWKESVRAFQLLNGKRLALTVFFEIGGSWDGRFEVRGVKPSPAAFLSLRTLPAGTGVSDGHANSVVIVDLFSRGRGLVDNCARLLW